MSSSRRQARVAITGRGLQRSVSRGSRNRRYWRTNRGLAGRLSRALRGALGEPACRPPCLPRARRHKITGASRRRGPFYTCCPVPAPIAAQPVPAVSWLIPPRRRRAPRATGPARRSERQRVGPRRRGLRRGHLLVAVAQHTTFHTRARDMGIYAQVPWNTGQRPFASTLLADNTLHLAEHVAPGPRPAGTALCARAKTRAELLVLQQLCLARRDWSCSSSGRGVGWAPQSRCCCSQAIA